MQEAQMEDAWDMTLILQMAEEACADSGEAVGDELAHCRDAGEAEV